MTGGWLREVGLQSSEAELSNEFDIIADHINKKISEFADTSFSGVIYSEETAKRAALNAKEFGVELLIISPLMWCEDILLKTILKELPSLPILFCFFSPYEKFESFMKFENIINGSCIVCLLHRMILFSVYICLLLVYGYIL